MKIISHVLLLSQTMMLVTSLYCEESSSLEPCEGKMNKNRDCKLYTFAHDLVAPVSRLVGENNMEGSRVDLIDEVCCRAGKICESVPANWTACWNRDNHRSQVLDSMQAHACLDVNLNWTGLADAYKATSIPFFKIPHLMGIVAKDSKLRAADFKLIDNSFKVASPAVHKLTVLKYRKGGFYVENENFIRVSDPTGPNAETGKVVEMVMKGEVDLGLVIPAATDLSHMSQVYPVFELDKFERGYVGMMTRKKDLGFMDWWDKFHKKFICSDEYAPYCERMKNKYGCSLVHCVSEVTRMSLCG